MARMAEMNSRIRGAGCDHGIENRFSMCGLICDPRPRQEPAARVGVEIPGQVGHGHRAAAEGHGDGRAELEPLGVLGGEDQGQERVVAGLGRPHRVVAGVFGLLGVAGAPAGQVAADRSVDVHGRG